MPLLASRSRLCARLSKLESQSDRERQTEDKNEDTKKEVVAAPANQICRCDVSRSVVHRLGAGRCNQGSDGRLQESCGGYGQSVERWVGHPEQCNDHVGRDIQQVLSHRQSAGRRQRIGNCAAGPDCRELAVGPMSRQMKPSELDGFEKKYGYKPTEVKVAVDTIAVWVHKDNPIKGLSLEQVDAIFSKSHRRG